jgi:hypothetical protein
VGGIIEKEKRKGTTRRRTEKKGSVPPDFSPDHITSKKPDFTPDLSSSGAEVSEKFLVVICVEKCAIFHVIRSVEDSASPLFQTQHSCDNSRLN